MSDSPVGPNEISCADVKSKLDAEDDFLLVDCREQNEYDAVNISGATLLPMSEVQDRVGELPKDKPIVIHCHHGGRSLRVTNWLLQNGFEDVKSMAGGIDKWAIEIDPSLPRY